jgi:copper chaperone CopZ
MDSTNSINVAQAVAPALETVDLGIAGMTTARSAHVIAKAFRGKNGVKRVHVDRAKSIARITFDPKKIHVPELHDILLESGYHPTRTAD